ncbi:helix-turn-helix domain-containing protein [Saccharothrix longispora]|uniref:Transcriptional regulator with XRE-family HTH domain n=1 Tax=Saccharothrix longispora TaxID=33920 RepID=A0ABU1PPS3_9PSEU|nr:helix-turn-helix transcriptional regulator [Saccharothrix longispora]MDR6592667.1 transcriptional regulator with XRE-family HTH domain [Saccharothrix longispora]
MDLEYFAGNASIGQRVARLRKLQDMRQRDLAERAHVSLSLLKKVESGHAPASPAFTTACATGLGVGVTVLTGQPYEDLATDPGTDRAAIPELRRALDSHDDPQLDEPLWHVDKLRTAVNDGEVLRRKSRYAQLAMRLPLLLQHLYANLALASGVEEAETAHALLDDAYSLVKAVTYRFGYLDLSALASDRLVASAQKSGDPLRVPVAAFRRSSLQLHRGDYGLGMRSVNRALAQAEKFGTPEALAVVAQLHLRQAVFQARVGSGRDADAHIEEARNIVTRGVPVSPYFDVRANLANVEFHSVAVPVEMSDGTTAVARAEAMHVDDREESTRVGHHHIDVARAWILHGNREKALRSLQEARTVSPQQTRYHPSVRETLHAIAAADARATDSLAGFAKWAGVTF